MKELKGRVAVVTGAASGIGRALAENFGREGMRVVLADVEGDALAATAQAIGKTGVEVLSVETDVTKPADVDRLAEKTLAAFGGVHVVCNNAGVFAGGLSWSQPLADYQWVLGVNMWGVIHGVRTFVPIMLERGEEGHIVNTASMAALTANPYAAAYHMSKHAVLAYSEVLYHELRGVGAQIGVSALCPEAVATQIDDCERNRPVALRTPPRAAAMDVELVNGAIRAAVASGIPTQVIADRVLSAIREDRFYVLSDADTWRRSSETRLDDIRLARNPTFMPPV
ncbi:MAG: SDR family NAD(P)-dependent oxidoreductase [Candidatus Binatia bacterium]